MNTQFAAARKTFISVPLIAAITGVCLALAGGNASPAENDSAAPLAPALKSEAEKRSYAIGMTVASQLRKAALDVDLEPFVQGLKDAYSGSKVQLTKTEFKALVGGLQKDQKTKLASAQSETRLKHKEEGEAFLAANKAKEGVVALESGLQYKILKAGSGEKPTLGDTVVCHYRAMLLDGHEFDNSYKRGKAAALPVKKLIKGWAEALQLMPVGSKWQLFIPAGLAYGEKGAGRDVGPDAALMFEVELVSIKDASIGDPRAGG